MTTINFGKVSILHSLKSDGDLIFKTNSSSLNEQVKTNRRVFFRKQNINPSRLANIYGKHGNQIFIVKEKDLGGGALNPKTRIEDYDGLITKVKNSYLAVTGADCLSVLFWDGKKGVIAATHNGWKGVKKEIVREAVKKFKNNFHSNLSDIKVWIGPGIRKCHYDIPEDRVKLFSKTYKKYIIKKSRGIYLDLVGIIKSQLKKSGIKQKNIIDSGECTYCETKKYFSYRRDHPKFVNAQIFIVHLKKH